MYFEIFLKFIFQMFESKMLGLEFETTLFWAVLPTFHYEKFFPADILLVLKLFLFEYIWNRSA